MDYAFEQLGDDRFQQLCQALISMEHPGVQCYPLGQADGGRDALALADGIVFQVKFTKHALVERDPHKWVMATIRDEVAKVKALIGKGARKYVLVTNVSGTAVPDVGSIDTVARCTVGPEVSTLRFLRG